MCILCTTPALQKVQKESSAITADGHRTLTGILSPDDKELIMKFYPVLSSDKLDTYISFFNAPRLYEVLVPLELLYRYLHQEFSNIRTPAVSVLTQTAYNPLSILSIVNGKVIRVKTSESELMHHAAEKLNLRQLTVEKINSMFDQLFGLQLRFACSCGVGIVRSDDLGNPDFIQFLDNREAMGRTYDSDVLSVLQKLYFCESIHLVPDDIILNSPDVGEHEIISYDRYYSNVEAIVDRVPVYMRFEESQVKNFFF